MSINAKGLEDLIKKLTKLSKFLTAQDGREVILEKESVFTKKPYLHHDTENKTEEESAAEERENPKLFAFRQALSEQIEDIL